MPRKLRGHDPKKAKPSRPKILIYGKPGVGKTWGALEFPGCYYIDTEGGADLEHYTDKLAQSSGVYVGPADGSNDFTVVHEEVFTLATQTHAYKTLIIDSYSKLYNTAIQIEYDRMLADSRDMTKTFGAEKKPAIAATRKMVRWFDRLDMNCIMVCHERDVWEDGKVIGKTFDGWDKLEYELHLVLHIVKRGKSHKAIVKKNRLAQFSEGETFDWCYDEFANRFGREAIEAAVEPVDAATDEQVTLATELAAAMRLDSKTRSKWFEKAGVDSFQQMDAETISKCIQHMQSQIPTASKE